MTDVAADQVDGQITVLLQAQAAVTAHRPTLSA